MFSLEGVVGSGGMDRFLVAETAEQVHAHFKTALPGAGIFFDVDDVLITPRSKLFRTKSPHNLLIDDIKKNRAQFINYEQIISNWRKQRKSMLVDDAWPSVVKDLSATHKVFALTRMDTGQIGCIPSMEEWRYQELLQSGITFPVCNQFENPLLDSQDNSKRPAMYYQGIFLTGSFTKREVIRAILKRMPLPEVNSVDDRLEELDGIAQECDQQGVPFRGVLFKGVLKLEGMPNPLVAEFQKRHLIDTAEWLEDDEAEQRLLGEEIKLWL